MSSCHRARDAREYILNLGNWNEFNQLNNHQHHVTILIFTRHFHFNASSASLKTCCVLLRPNRSWSIASEIKSKIETILFSYKELPCCCCNILFAIFASQEILLDIMVTRTHSSHNIKRAVFSINTFINLFNLIESIEHNAYSNGSLMAAGLCVMIVTERCAALAYSCCQCTYLYACTQCALPIMCTSTNR